MEEKKAFDIFSSKIILQGSWYMVVWNNNKKMNINDSGLPKVIFHYLSDTVLFSYPTEPR